MTRKEFLAHQHNCPKLEEEEDKIHKTLGEKVSFTEIVEGLLRSYGARKNMKKKRWKKSETEKKCDNRNEQTETVK